MHHSIVSLYLVTDRELAHGRSLLSIVRQAVVGGVTCVQLRDKQSDTRQLVTEARELLQFLRPRRIPLIINDRVDVALASDADGVHLGQSDMELIDARHLLGPHKLIGISAESVAEAVEAAAAGADYVGISPVFATTTKIDTGPPLGLSGVRQIRQRVTIPLVGIGGISPANAASVVQHGADGVAVVSAIVSAPDPEQAARELAAQVRTAAARTGDG